MDRDDIKLLGEILGGMMVLFGVLFVIAIFADRASCHASFRGSALQTRYGVMSGCQVKSPNAGWIPADNYRSIQ
jgi:hypothetical protein